MSNIFEIESGIEIPERKADLAALYKDGRVITFHKHMFAKGHVIPGHNEWLTDRAKGIALLIIYTEG